MTIASKITARLNAAVLTPQARIAVGLAVRDFVVLFEHAATSMLRSCRGEYAEAMSVYLSCVQVVVDEALLRAMETETREGNVVDEVLLRAMKTERRGGKGD